MNSNSFLSSSNNLQSLGGEERLKSLFKSSAELAGSKQSQLTHQEALKISISQDGSSGRQVFSKSIEYSFGLKFESSYEFKVPSPKEVASTVLGFVENRINAEKSSGASNERLNDLLAQARTGIEKGYAQAEEDIKSLGLMTDELSEDISEGYVLINNGLDKVEKNINGAVGVDSSPSKSLESQLAKQKQVDDVLSELALPSSSSSLFSSLGVAKSDENKNGNLSAAFNRLTASTADFVLNTREGDQVYIRASDLQSLSYSENADGEKLNMAQSSGFEFSVVGDLNDEELVAINEILEQVGNISSLFFSDQFEDAFSSALNLGFDSSQIASFALDLSKLQIQEVRTYEKGPGNAMDSYKRNQPLINMAQQFEHLSSLIQPLERFEKINSIVDALIFKALDNYSLAEPKESEEKLGYVSDLQSFSRSLLSSTLIEE